MSMSNSPAVRSKARSAWDTKTLVSMAMLTGIAYRDAGVQADAQRDVPGL